MTKRLLKIILWSIIIVWIISCDTAEPPPDDQPDPVVKSVALSVDKFTCTEVWLSVTSENLILPRTADIYRNDSLYRQFNLDKPDTLLYFDDLLPAREYKFVMTIPEDTIESNTPAFRTLDTTSHNFTYQTWEFGDYSINRMLDAAIINENDIWAVGEFYLKDSLGNSDPKPYNALHWDGNDWEAKRITVDFRGSQITPPLEGIFAFSSTDIWFSSGIPIHGDGQNWTLFHLFDMGILTQEDGSLKKIWGISSNNLYFIGRLGTIVYYTENNWQKIESETTEDINDIWGYSDELILGTISPSIFHQGEKMILKISRNDVTNFDWTPQVRVATVYFEDPYKIYAGGEGIYAYTNNKWKNIPEITGFFISKVRGSGSNDIWAVGGSGYAAHFNGLSWKVIKELRFSGNYLSVAVSRSRVCMVGETSSKAVITLISK